MADTSTTAQPPSVRRGRRYSTRITGLRMATTYSFEVRPVRRDARDLADPQSIGSKIVIVPTKGCKHINYLLYYSMTIHYTILTLKL